MWTQGCVQDDDSKERSMHKKSKKKKQQKKNGRDEQWPTTPTMKQAQFRRHPPWKEKSFPADVWGSVRDWHTNAFAARSATTPSPSPSR